MGRNDRPEISAPPEIFYNEDEARKYTENSRMVAIQTQLTERALELLALPDDGEPKLLLDLGCGSGLSGEALTERGHIWLVSTDAQAGSGMAVGDVKKLLRPAGQAGNHAASCAACPVRSRSPPPPPVHTQPDHGPYHSAVPCTRAWTSARRCWMWRLSGRWRVTCACMTWGTACPSDPAWSTAPSPSLLCSGCAMR